MADESGFLGGYKVGSISASLCTESGKEGRKKKRDSSSIFISSEITQPAFIPIKKKKKSKNEDNLNKRNNVGAIDMDGDKKHTGKINKLPKNRSYDDDPERLARTIFVGNLPLSISQKDLKKFFKKYGEIESARMRSVAVPDLKTSKKLAAIKKTFNPNRNSFNGYVVFKDKETVVKALASNGALIGDLHIRVDNVDSSVKQHDHKRSVFVGNLVFDVKEEALREFFSPCGEVQNARIIRDSITGIGKGFGYILFKDSGSVSLALKLNNAEFCGRKIRIQRSQENPKGSSMSQEQKRKNFSGTQAKERFYNRRKMLKQQKKFGLANSKQNPSKINKKSNKRTSLKQNRKKK